MKKFISKIQNLSERAAQLQAAMQNLPPKFEQIREAVSMTTGQLQQLRSDVQMSVADLKADNEVLLLDSLREINSSVTVFHQAGYDLTGVDMELSPVQRLIVHLNRVGDVSETALRSLLAKSESRRITRAILASLIRAEETADQVDLTNLVYHKLIVNVGPIPSVRLCWTTEEEGAVPVPQAAPVASASAATPTPKPEPTSTSVFSSYGKGSFFDRPTPASTPSAVTSSPVSTESSAKAVPAASSLPQPQPAPLAKDERARQAKDWGSGSLERFKKMPDVSKYRR